MGLRHLLEGLDRDLTLVIRESAARDRTSVLVKSDYEALLDRLRGLLERLDGLSVAQVERLVEDPDLVQLAFHAGEEAAAIRKGATARDRLAPSLRFMARHQRPILDLVAHIDDAPDIDGLSLRLARRALQVYQRRFASHYLEAGNRRPFIDKLHRDYRRGGLPACLLTVLNDVAAGDGCDRVVVVLRGALGYAVLLEALGFPADRLRFVACGPESGSHLDPSRRFEPIGFEMSDLTGQRVLLLDNNVLSGRTLRRCLDEIGRAGAARVSALIDYLVPGSPEPADVRAIVGAEVTLRVARDAAAGAGSARPVALYRKVERRLDEWESPGACDRPAPPEAARGFATHAEDRPPSLADTVTFVDRPQVVTVGPHVVQYAPMRLEWRRVGSDAAPLEPVELRFQHVALDPFVIQVQVTQACNLACSYCTALYNPRPTRQRTLSDEEIRDLKREIRALPPHGLLILMGGEPFLEPDTVFALVEAAPVTVVIFTNATLLTPGHLRRLAGTRAVLLLSVDGDEETTAVKRFARRRDDAVGRVFASLQMVAESEVPYGISIVLGSHNIDEIEGQVERLKDRYDPASFGVSTPHFAASAPGADALAPERIAAAYLRLFKLAVRRGIYIDQIARRLRPLVEGRPLIRDCSATGQKRVYYPGGVWVNCANQERKDAPLDVWARRLPVFTPSCHDCLGIGACGGGCIYDAGKYGTTQNPFDARHCATVRALTLAFLEHVAARQPLGAAGRDQLRDEFAPILGRRGQALRFSTGHMTRAAD